MHDMKKTGREGIGPDGASAKPGGAGRTYGESKACDDIIELSEIATETPGKKAEDKPVYDSADSAASGTEDIEGPNGSTGAVQDREYFLMDDTVQPDESATGKTVSDMDRPGFAAPDRIDAIEEDITKEIDNYFQLEEQAIDLLDDTVEKGTLPVESVGDSADVFDEDLAAFTNEQLESALENVIEKLYAEKIDQILNRVIERVVREDIESLKQYILNHSK